MLKKKVNNPFVGDYTPEMDEIYDMNKELASWYQSLIDMLRYMVEISRADIITEVSMMASQMDMPREEHLEEVLNVFAFPSNSNSRMVFDPTYPVINMSNFKKCKWRYFYGKLREAIPTNAPEERRK